MLDTKTNSECQIKLDQVSPISQGITPFSMPLSSPTAVEASLITTKVTRKTQSMKSPIKPLFLISLVI